MKPEEKSRILSKWNAAIVAPAGHGKTEMIVDLVAEAEGKSLIVTHTNAGVEALRNRLKSKRIDSKKFSITTIASFCLLWCRAYSYSADYIELTEGNESIFYERLYDGTTKIFENAWARQVLGWTYEHVFVDEYQDCSVRQHRIFENINKSIPVIIFGDPLQSIFGWADELVSWNNLCFERVNVNTSPWRWRETNPELGNFLTDTRKVLEAGLEGRDIEIKIEPVGDYVNVVHPACKYDNSLIDMVNANDNVVYITKWKKDQEDFSRTTAGRFQNDEPQDIKDLYNFAREFDKSTGFDRAYKLVTFLEQTATHVKKFLLGHKNKIQRRDCDFSNIENFSDFSILIKSVCQEEDKELVIKVLDWLKEKKHFKIFRKELFYEMRRAIEYSIMNNISIFESAQKIRTSPSLQQRYHRFRMLSSRTVLSKGLEFDCVIIDLKGEMSVTDYYVALTRARRKVIIISDQPIVKLKGLQTRRRKK